ncbi:MAG TPA: hypothetical protein DCL21_00920 [Alphaproteobacteria bacterium]|nr:hypothetical protein [Alphaproteobacteria bacterium]
MELSSPIDLLTMFAILANTITVLNTIIYIYSIYKGKTKPHTFTWFNWTILSAITAYAQFSVNGGLSTWIFAFSALTMFLVTIISLFKGVKKIAKSDWFAFLIALTIIPIWYTTKNPVLALVLIMVIDIFSYFPTVRKSWIKPFSEPASVYFLAVLNSALTVVSIAEPTLSNTFYPAFVVLLDLGFMLMLLIRRTELEKYKLAA